MNESMNILLSAVAIIFIAIFGIMYFTGSMAALDQGVNATGTEYEGVYDSTRSTVQISISFFSWVPILLAVSLIVFGAMMLYNAGQGRLK
jgi:ABC-type amino acid transport system permease subunit